MLSSKTGNLHICALQPVSKGELIERAEEIIQHVPDEMQLLKFSVPGSELLRDSKAQPHTHSQEAFNFFFPL